jgi:hypothetical protein
VAHAELYGGDTRASLVSVLSMAMNGLTD